MASVILTDVDNKQPTDNLRYGSDKLNEEKDTIKISYPKTWVANDLKDFKIVMIFVQPYEEFNITFKFKLTPDYPSSVPDISIISDCLPKTTTNDLQCLLDTKSLEMIGKPMVLKLIKEAEKYLLRCDMMSVAGHPSGTKIQSKNKPKKMKNTGKSVDAFSGFRNDVDIDGNTQKQKKSKKKKRKEFDPHDDSDEADYYNHLQGEMEIGTVNSQISITTSFSYKDEDGCASKIKRPTHFIAIRVSNADIKKGLADVQKELVEKEPLLDKGQFAPDIFHLTLCTLGLDTPEQVTHCIDTLEAIKPALRSALPVNPLVIHGMSQFYNRAVYTKVKYCEDFVQFLQVLRGKLQELSVEIRDEHEKFTPHVTIIKVKRPERRLFGFRNIQPSIYSHQLDTVFGEQYVDTLYLCCMDGQRRDDGFYVTLHEMHLC